MKPMQSMLLSMTPMKRYGLGAAIELSPTSFLDVGVVRHNLLRGGNSASGVSSLRSTGGGTDSEAGSGGSGDDGNDGDDQGHSGDGGGNRCNLISLKCLCVPAEGTRSTTGIAEESAGASAPPPRHHPRLQRAPHPHPSFPTNITSEAHHHHPLHHQGSQHDPPCDRLWIPHRLEDLSHSLVMYGTSTGKVVAQDRARNLETVVLRYGSDIDEEDMTEICNTQKQSSH
ncbi:hypothetical protein Tco_0386798 [Tanacetum coccineum]